MAKHPELHRVVLETFFSRQLSREGAHDGAICVPRIDRASVSRRTPMREDDDVASFKGRDLRVEPCEVSPVCLIMRPSVPVLDLEKVVEADADSHLALGRDGGEETATEDGDVRVW